MKPSTAAVVAAVLAPSLAAGLSSGRHGHALRGGAVETTSPLPTEDGVCIDVKGWVDARGYNCGHYQKEQYCTAKGEPGPGWWQTWGTLGAYASTAGTSGVDACCACGGGVITCCKSYKAFEAEKAGIIKQVRKFAGPLDDKARIFVGNAGRLAEATLVANLSNVTAVRGAQYVNASAVVRRDVLKETQDIFSNLTQHRDELYDSAQFHLVHASSEATWEAVNKTVDLKHQKVLAVGALDAFKNAKVSWEFTRANISEMAKTGWLSLKEYYSDHNASMSQLVTDGEAVNKFADDSQKAGEEVRWGRQASLLAAELTDLAGNRTESVDGLVHQAEGRTARALQLTSANSGVLDKLEGMVAESEEGSELAGQVSAAR